MRDISHQTEGAAALGLFAANHNMLSRFAASAAASRSWAAFWEIDGNGKPSSFDYLSDADFWFNLPANFDVLDAAVRMWRWTGDNTYRDDPRFRQFFRETLTDYVEQWQLQPTTILARERIVNRKLLKGEFADSRGIPSYSEGTADFVVGADLLAAEYRAIRSYAEIAVEPHDKALSSRMQHGADRLQRILETVVWSPQERHFYGRIRGDRSGAGSGDTLVLYFGAAKNPDSIRGALDYVANPKYWGQINIEEESYVPIVLFRYGRSEEAYKVLFDLTRPGKLRREYPEVSFCSANCLNTSPKCGRSWPYSFFRRHFGINITWYLRSHFVSLKLSKPGDLPFLDSSPPDRLRGSVGATRRSWQKRSFAWPQLQVSSCRFSK
jgi:hypothetical protein